MIIKKSQTPKTKKPRVNVIDFLNVFSDYREMKYLKMNVDFHKIKHDALIADTFYFFEMFFGLYIEKIGSSKDDDFVFIMKNMVDYDVILPQVMDKFSDFKIKFVTVTDEFDDVSLQKSKDDFLCQYFYSFLNKDPSIECILVSNDLYRDKREYLYRYTSINIDMIKLNDKKNIKLDINKELLPLIMKGYFKRKSIPKYELLNYLK